MVTGFTYQNTTKDWVQRNFKGNQFILKPLKPSDKTGEENYGVYEVERGALLFRCKYWFPEVGVAHCGNENDYHFKFFREKDRTGKFVSSDLKITSDVFTGQPPTPRIGIGSCVQVD